MASLLIAVMVLPRIAAQDSKTPTIERELQKELEKLLEPGAPENRGKVAMVRGNDGNLKWGGGRLQNVSASLQEKLGLPDNEGMLVTALDSGSAAEKAGLKVNDVLVKINNQPVPGDLNGLVKLVREQKSVDKVDLVVLRDGKEESILNTRMPAVVQLDQASGRWSRGLAGLDGVELIKGDRERDRNNWRDRAKDIARIINNRGRNNARDPNNARAKNGADNRRPENPGR
jgi:C-terminal processing protease CtpA/Prc